MSQRVARTATVLRAIVHEFRTERVTFMAGSIAYYAFISLLPLLLLLLTVASTVGGRTLESGLVALAESVVTPGAGEALVSELRNTSTGVSAFGLALLVWGALRIFRNLDRAFSDIYETQSANSFLDQLKDAGVVLAAVAGVVVAVLGIESLLSIDAGASFGWLAGRLLLVVAIAAVLLPMYYFFPDETDMHVAEAVPGVVVTSVGLVVAESLFRLYVEYSASLADGSVLAGILVFLTWLYVTGLLLLLGAVVNAVLSNRSRDVQIRPVLGGKAAGAEGDRPRYDPVPGIEALEERLVGARRVQVYVDGEEIELVPPDRVQTDTGQSRVPFVDDGVGVQLEWSDGGARPEQKERA